MQPNGVFPTGAGNCTPLVLPTVVRRAAAGRILSVMRRHREVVGRHLGGNRWDALPAAADLGLRSRSLRTSRPDALVGVDVGAISEGRAMALSVRRPYRCSARAPVSGGYPRLAASRTLGPKGRVPVRSHAPWLQASAWRVRRRDDRRSGRQTLSVSVEGIRAISRGLGDPGADRVPLVPSELNLLQLAILIKRHSLYRPERN